MESLVGAGIVPAPRKGMRPRPAVIGRGRPCPTGSMRRGRGGGSRSACRNGLAPSAAPPPAAPQDGGGEGHWGQPSAPPLVNDAPEGSSRSMAPPAASLNACRADAGVEDQLIICESMFIYEPERLPNRRPRRALHRHPRSRGGSARLGSARLGSPDTPPDHLAAGNRCLHDEAREGDDREGVTLRPLVHAGDAGGAKARRRRTPGGRCGERAGARQVARDPMAGTPRRCSYSSPSAAGTPAPLSRKAKAPPWTSAPIAFGSSGAVAMIVSAQSSALSSGR